MLEMRNGSGRTKTKNEGRERERERECKRSRDKGRDVVLVPVLVVVLVLVVPCLMGSRPIWGGLVVGLWVNNKKTSGKRETGICVELRDYIVYERERETDGRAGAANPASSSVSSFLFPFCFHPNST
ncbi:hypothetical protein FRC18_006034 [Serendipita sp. 400]|nr:hypothetical protein FRC18_006034 [Serendipita sp. 400]